MIQLYPRLAALFLGLLTIACFLARPQHGLDRTLRQARAREAPLVHDEVNTFSIVAFDPDTVGVEPMERVFDLPAGADRLIVHSRGIEHVWVNGTAIRTDGKDVDDAHPGVLMRGGAT